jgi:hypothetical protein
MAIKETSDENLIFELLESDCVILKYHSDTCGEVCEKLRIVYRELSEDSRYRDIMFLRINADDNPIALKHIQEKKQPIMNIYHKGDLVECRTVDSRTRIEGLLDKLIDFRAGDSTSHE